MAEIKTENPFPTIEQAIVGAELALAKSYERSLRPYREVAKKAAKDLMKPPSFTQRLRSIASNPFLSNLVLAAGTYGMGLGMGHGNNDIPKYVGASTMVVGLGLFVRAFTKLGIW